MVTFPNFKYIPLFLTILTVLGIFSLPLTLSSCNNSSSGSPVNDCSEPGAACPSVNGSAQFCALVDNGSALQCTNVCENPATFAPYSVAAGGQCELDRDCESGTTCDNDVVGGGATCRCVTTSTCEASPNDWVFWSPSLLGACSAAQYTLDFSGTVGRWDIKRTCRTVAGDCSETEDRIGIGRDSGDYTDVCWVDGAGSDWPGQLCGSDFSFAKQGAVEYETGIFHFSTSTDFEADWIIYDQPDGEIVARCKGKGSAVSAGSPDDPPNCNEYNPFAPPVVTPVYDGVFNERYSCVQDGVCVDHDETSSVIITLGTTQNSYRIASSDGFYNGNATLIGSDLHFGASYHDPAQPDHDYTETGIYSYSDSDHFSETTSYKITATGSVGNCTGKAARGNETPAPPDPLGPCL